MTARTTFAVLAAASLSIAGCKKDEPPKPAAPVVEKEKPAEVTKTNTDESLKGDGSDGQWLSYNGRYDATHYSPLTEISDQNVDKLGLAWALDLPVGNSHSSPVAVDGVIYFSQGYAVISAVDALTGKVLWKYDPKVTAVAGDKLRTAWGTRGITYANGKVYAGTQDGRLFALNAKDGSLAWSVDTTQGKTDGRYITGAPLYFDGKVLIGHGGADFYKVRGYVTAYDAETGKKVWRFFTVPGNPADGPDGEASDDVMAMAAKTWKGEWWKHGGGGTVWNAMTYDAELDRVYLGTGNGAPWNQDIRSPGGGDNFFLCSIIALDAKTGKYVWHYAVNPGETWDFNAAMDMQLATLDIDGTPTKVLMQAPKNASSTCSTARPGSSSRAFSGRSRTGRRRSTRTAAPSSSPTRAPRRTGSCSSTTRAAWALTTGWRCPSARRRSSSTSRGRTRRTRIRARASTRRTSRRRSALGSRLVTPPPTRVNCRRLQSRRKARSSRGTP
ncbi:MAG: PQQ-binding-like beta-propeller repeat protein [Archangium sp.]